MTKKKDYFEVLPITDSLQERTWKLIPSGFLEKITTGDIIAKKEGGKIKLFEKYRIQKGSPITTTWINKKYNAKKYGTNLLESLFGGKLFSYPKSLYAVLDILKIMTNKDDIILDFFSGSGTTGHAVLELNKEDGGNRQFILVEQLNKHIEVNIKRISKVMENNSKEKTLNNFNKYENFIYCELMKYNEEAIDKIESAKTTENLIKIWKEMVEHYFLNYDVDIKRFNDSQEEFKKLPIEKQKKLLVEMLNKNQLYVNLSEIDDTQFKVSKEDKELNKKFYK